ncbi:hypothetical protein sphantq_04511 (plasmid) [Sphingobium sp. AntQ-1]|uniref:hypothetical protein n=1 Tax=Sphingobium sp. AntQ-1 TaxID=2930091 RepID=UPI00234E375D|nr:hypothetical protein [Sphingobium sp. AntQ-1]WCP16019.1 hypothetical protein sphantq_04511 [Sphingobium sp. AntQ-1]
MSEDTTPISLGKANAAVAPLRVNALEFGRVVNATLVPMFPYLHPGAIVPCSVVNVGGPGHQWRMFQHYNDVDEVYTCFAAQGGNAKSGQIMAGARTHFVNVALQDDNDENQFNFLVVTQRQWEKPEPQAEYLTVVCEQCQEPIYKHSYTAEISAAEKELVEQTGAVEPLATPIETARLGLGYNESGDFECKECGYLNGPFPLEQWGWPRYLEQSRASLQAAALLKAAFATDRKG